MKKIMRLLIACVFAGTCFTGCSCGIRSGLNSSSTSIADSGGTAVTEGTNQSTSANATSAAVTSASGAATTPSATTSVTTPQTAAPATLGPAAGTASTDSEPMDTTPDGPKDEVIPKLDLGKVYDLKLWELVFQNLYRGEDKSGREGLLMEYTQTFIGDSSRGESAYNAKKLELEIHQAGQRVEGGTWIGHDSGNGKSKDLLPGGTLQKQSFYLTDPNEEIEIIFHLFNDEGNEYRVKAAYPSDKVDPKSFKEKLKAERLKLNETYRAKTPGSEDLSLVGEALSFEMADVVIREVKTVPNDIIGGRDLIVTYSYKTKPSKDDYMNIQMAVFQYGVEIDRRFIDTQSRPSETEFRDGDFIVNYRDVGALVVQIHDPHQSRQLVYLPR